QICNVSSLILQNAEGAFPNLHPETLEERWIIARMDGAHSQINDAFATFAFSRACDVLYHLVFDEFCDWYAEAIKPRLYDDEERTRATAVAVLERVLKLLHPVMPHVTEEIW